MQFKSIFTISSVIIFAVFFSSCKKDKCEQTVTYKTYKPVYMSYEELRNSVRSETAKALQHPGKIYLKGSYIFVNEMDKGIHVIDNSNPVSPQNIAFINIPGNQDIAAWGEVLYADSYTDLLALDISNPRNIQVLSRTENALPYRSYSSGYYVDAQLGVVIDWKEEVVTEKVNGNCDGSPIYYGRGPWMEGDIMFNSSGGTPVRTSSTSSPNKGGSMARFAVANQTLYIVDNTSLKTYSIQNPSAPAFSGTTTVGQNIETIFPYNNHLFIGSSAGMFIYNIYQPLAPVHVSTYTHVFACDPVAVEGNYAYVTLRSGTPCNNSVNQLEVIGIENLSAPSVIKTVPMSNPHGVGVENNTVYVCDRPEGLRVLDASDVTRIDQAQLAVFSAINAYDVIPYGQKLIMIADDGLYQYDCHNAQNIQLLSKISVAP